MDTHRSMAVQHRILPLLRRLRHDICYHTEFFSVLHFGSLPPDVSAVHNIRGSMDPWSGADIKYMTDIPSPIRQKRQSDQLNLGAVCETRGNSPNTYVWNEFLLDLACARLFRLLIIACDWCCITTRKFVTKTWKNVISVTPTTEIAVQAVTFLHWKAEIWRIFEKKVAPEISDLLHSFWSEIAKRLYL